MRFTKRGIAMALVLVMFISVAGWLLRYHDKVGDTVRPLAETAALTAGLADIAEIYRFRLPDDPPRWVALSSDGGRVAYDSWRYSKIFVRDLESGEVHQIALSRPGAKARRLTWHPGGRKLYGCAYGGLVTFDAIGYREESVTTVPERYCQDITVQPDGVYAYVVYARGDDFDIRKYDLRSGVTEVARASGSDTRQVANRSLVYVPGDERLYFFAARFPAGSTYFQKSNLFFPDAVVEVRDAHSLALLDTVELYKGGSFGYGAGVGRNPVKGEFAIGATVGPRIGHPKNDVVLPTGERVRAEDLNETRIAELTKAYGPLKFVAVHVANDHHEALRIVDPADHKAIDLIGKRQANGEPIAESISQLAYTADGSYLIAGSAVRLQVDFFDARCLTLLSSRPYDPTDISLSATGNRLAVADIHNTSIVILQLRQLRPDRKCPDRQ